MFFESSQFIEENPILLKSTSHQYLKNLVFSPVCNPTLIFPNELKFVLLSYNFLSKLIFLDFFPSFETSMFWNFA